MHTLSSKKTVGKFFSFIFFGVALALFFLSGNSSAKAACDYPAQVLDLTNCKQTLPTGKSGSPTEIKQPALATYAAAPYFHINQTCDGVIFRAPVNGVTTSNSGYPRSELREMADGGTKNASWSTTSGTHTMFLDGAITAVPKTKKHVVFGQIHDADDDVVVVRLEYPKLFVDINGKTGPTLDANYKLGKRFTVEFVASDGKINLFYNGNKTAAYTMSKSASGCYFKAGAYTQSNCSKESDCSKNNFGEVVIYNLSLNGKAVISQASTTAQPKSPDTETAAPASPVATTSSPTSGIIFEAESGTVTAPMQIKENTLASDGKYVVQTTGSDTGSVEYKINVPEAGQYQLRAKVISPDGSSNSFYYAFDETSSNTWHLPNNIKEWSWTDGPIISLTQGEHILLIKKRETKTRLDTFEIMPVASSSETTETVIDGTEPFEAEAGIASGGMRVVSNDPTASDGKYVAAETSGSVAYHLNIPISGVYRLAGWIKAHNGSSDSFSISMDGKSSATWTLGYPATSWNYDINDGRTFSLTAGSHTLTIKYREKGAKLDKAVLLKQ